MTIKSTKFKCTEDMQSWQHCLVEGDEWESWR